MALRVILPGASVRKVGEPREWTRKNGARAGEVVRETQVAIEDGTGEPLTATIDHTKLEVPSRGDTIDLEIDLDTYSARDSYDVQLRLTVVHWTLTA